MTVQLGNHWPLVAVPQPKDVSLQSKVRNALPLHNQQDPPLVDDPLDHEPHDYWEKGLLIDIYI